MNIHEYQAKGLLADYGVPVPRGTVAETPAEAARAAQTLPGPVWAVKAQIHAGGRGKGGGIKLCRNAAEVEKAAGEIIGMRLVTPQTGPEGRLVKKVWVEQGTDMNGELYLAVVLDRGGECLSVMASPSGGMDIEEVAERTPEKIFTARLDAAHRLWPFQARRLMFACGLDGRQAAQGAALVAGLARLCAEKDATQVEINPLAVDAEGRLIALDAKVNFDDSALFRHPDIRAMADPDESDPLERRAAELGVSYVRLSGHVGTMVNGAGLAMATMDAIKQAGAEPANFLDAGGGADAERIAEGFGLMLSDPGVRGVLVNIFGGILRCDIVAEGIVAAAARHKFTLPIVLRMEGTNVEAARGIIRKSGLPVHEARSMGEASAMIADLTKEVAK